MRRPKRIYVAGVPAAPASGRPVASAVRPKGNQWDPFEESFLIDPTVFDDGPAEWEPTGLLDEHGQPIMALSGGRDPIGFLWHDETGRLRPRDEVIERFNGGGADLD